MVQGGGFDRDLVKKVTGAPVVNEADNGLKNNMGTIAMARTNQPHSATSQFFINVKDNRFLDHTGKNPRGWGYAVFGKVTDGIDVINSIKQLPTKRMGPHANVPIDTVLIERAYVLDLEAVDPHATSNKAKPAAPTAFTADKAPASGKTTAGSK